MFSPWFCSILIIVFVNFLFFVCHLLFQSSRWRRPGSSRIVVQVTPERLTIAAAFPFVASSACTELGKKITQPHFSQYRNKKIWFFLYSFSFYTYVCIYVCSFVSVLFGCFFILGTLLFLWWRPPKINKKNNSVGPDNCKCEPGYGGPTCNIGMLCWVFFFSSSVSLFFVIWLCIGGTRVGGGIWSGPVSLLRSQIIEPDLFFYFLTYGENWLAKLVQHLFFVSNAACPEHKWGPNCSNSCPCLNGAKCDPVNGSCTCTAGWKGLHCDYPCPKNYYGQSCSLKCQVIIL